MKEKSRNVRLQVFVSSQIDDKLDDLSEAMGLHKNEIVRIAIANYLYGVSESVNMVRDIAEKKIQLELDKAKNQKM